MRRRSGSISARALVLAAVAFSIALVAASTAAFAQLEPAPADPALFNLEFAQAELDELHIQSDRVRTELNAVLDSIDGLTIDRDSISLNDRGRNERLQDARTNARRMAVSAYLGLGPPVSGLIVLDAESVNELNYRSGLLRQQAALLQTEAETYAVLAGEADAAVVALSDEINNALRQAEALNRELATYVEQIPYAEWVVSIAQIHAEADRVFERTQRAEPTAEQWQKLRFCESTETYGIDTGNTFYGAYQFTWETWGTVGGSDNPAHAPPAEQDARARLLYADRGSQPWPICGRYLP